jgi:hypothetical protein
MTEIQQKITDYLKYDDNHTFTLRCFVGMLETGEATPDDFDAVQPGLAADVAREQTRIYATTLKITPTRKEN